MRQKRKFETCASFFLFVKLLILKGSRAFFSPVIAQPGFVHSRLHEPQMGPLTLAKNSFSCVASPIRVVAEDAPM
jgi:hypothetical protein